MLHIDLIEQLIQERQQDWERALERQHQIRTALAGQQRHTAFRFALLSRVLIGLGTRLVGWGQHLQPAPARTD